MLDAYLRKGARLPTQNGVDTGRRVIEDAITSTLFTPLRFMAPVDVGQIVSLLTGTKCSKLADAAEVNLWPRVLPASSSSNSRFVEPDIIVDLHYDGVLARTVIEIKWDDILGREQVEAQVSSCASGLKPSATFSHFSIVKSANEEALEYRGTSVRQWYDVLRDLKGALSGEPTAIPSKVSLEWSRDAVIFLERLGIGTFVGFGKIDLLAVPHEMDIPIFTRYAWVGIKSIAPINENLGLIGNQR
jgi:hypothetical protein